MLITYLQHYIHYIAWTVFLVTWGVKYFFGFNFILFIYHVVLVYFSRLRVCCGFTLWL